jgi:hypothetical protein
MRTIQPLQLCIFYFIAHTYWSFLSVLSKTSRNTRRCSAGPQNKVRIHGIELTLAYFRRHELLAGCLGAHTHGPASTVRIVEPEEAIEGVQTDEGHQSRERENIDHESGGARNQE